MNAGALLGIVIAGMGALFTVYFMARQNKRENDRAEQQRTETAVQHAMAPLLATIVQQRDDLALTRQTLAQREARIDQLEDELRRRRRDG